MAKLRLVARIGPRRSILTPFVAGSFLVHAGLATMVMFAPALHRGNRVLPGAIPVTIVALSGPKPKPQAQAARPPQPERQDRPKAQPKKKAAPPQDQKPARPSEPVPQNTEPAEEPAPEEPAADLPPDDGPEPVHEGPGDGDGGSRVASLDILGSEFAWYNSSVTSKLTGNWQRPLLGGVSRTLTVVVGFTIRKDGSVQDVEILTSSGVPSVDRSVLRAVYDSAPLPRIPPGLRESSLPARFEFRWHPDR